MQGLLLDRDLRKSSKDSEVRSVARAITTTVMRELDASRNALLIDFLQESNLANSNGDSGEENIEYATILSGLNLYNAKLSEVYLRNADLSGTDLSGTDLVRAELGGANLSKANLIGANLTGANLSKANFTEADLTAVNLSAANLTETNLTGADLSLASGSVNTLSGADLSGADLSGVKFITKAKLELAVLCKTQLPESIDLDPDRDCK